MPKEARGKTPERGGKKRRQGSGSSAMRQAGQR